MQFKKAMETPAGDKPAGASGPPRGRRPQWLMDWIAEHGIYVVLECGHKDSFATIEITLCLIRTFPGMEVLCNECNAFRKVAKSVTLIEYMGIPTPERSSEPPF